MTFGPKKTREWSRGLNTLEARFMYIVPPLLSPEVNENQIHNGIPRLSPHRSSLLRQNLEPQRPVIQGDLAARVNRCREFASHCGLHEICMKQKRALEDGSMAIVHKRTPQVLCEVVRIWVECIVIVQ